MDLKKVISTELTTTRLFALAVLCISVIGVWNSLKFGSAALNYSSVRNALEVWQSNAKVQTKEDYEQAFSAIKSAQFKHGSHPLYADTSGQVTEWGLFAGYESQDALEKAEQAYIRASKLRPTWPVTWASLALIKWRKQEFDSDMLNYLRLADKFGPQKPEVHVMFSQLGLALYQANHPFYRDIRETVQNRLISGLRHEASRDQVMLAVQQNNAQDFACIWAETRDRYVYDNIIECAQ